jgi:hypothetical protein
VVLLSLSRGTLGKVRDAVYTGLPENDRRRLHFMSPEEFFTFLDAREPVAKETTVGGYKVKVKYRPAEGEAATRKSKAVSEILLKSLKKMKEKE